jgi:ABC-2 type transport system permease protein
MSKLSAVIRHEYGTVVKQTSFWIYMVTMPLIFAAIFVLVGIANRTPNTTIDDVATDLKGVAIVDDSGLISREIAEASGQTIYPSEQLSVLRESVEAGDRKGLVYYPSDLLETKQYDIYVNGVDFVFSNSVNEAAGALLQTSLYLPLGSEEQIALAQQGAEGLTTTYANGTTSVGFSRFIVPGAIAAMFFIILFFSIGYILTSIADEKENRSMEMALTYLSPRTLIIGKLIAIVLITLTQLLFFAVLALVAVFIAVQTNFIRLPNINLAELPFEPVSVLLGLGFVVVGFVLFAGAMALTAVLLPAKQANNFSAFFYILPFVPFWFIYTVLTDPNNPIVQLITYFPITAPTTNLIRNTVGNIPPSEALLSLGIMTVTAVALMWLVIKVFPKGALEFQNPLSLKAVFSRK